MVDDFLRLGFGQNAFAQIALKINIQERRDPAHRHGGAVLRLDRGQIAKIQPLHRFLGVGCRSGNVVAIRSGHFLHAFQRLDLIRNFLALADDVVGHRAIAAIRQILLFFPNQKVDSIKRHPAVVADDPAASIRIRQSGHDFVAARQTHFRRVRAKHRVVVRFVVFRKNLMQLLARLVAVRRARLLAHTNAAIRHKRAFQRFVRLQTNHLLQIFQRFANVSWSIGSQARNNFRLHIQHAVFGPLLFLQPLQFAP